MPPLFVTEAGITALACGLETTVVTVFEEPDEPEATASATAPPATAPATAGKTVLKLLMS
jgi:hypothetical protein